MPLGVGLALALVLLGSRLIAAPPGQTEPMASTVQVIDGDTIQVDGQVTHLFGIVAPELGQRCWVDGVWSRCGMNAAFQLNKLIGVSQVPLRCTRVDSGDSSPTATCMAGQTDIAHALLVGGYVLATAEADPQYRAAETEASRAKLGIWQSEFVTPADWRAGERLSGRDDVDMDPCPVKATATAAGERIFFVPTDADYESVTVDAARGERLFCSVEAARAAGWRHQGEVTDASN